MAETYTYKHLVIVHGIGDQAPNETALGFMNEFLRALPQGNGYSVDVFNLVASVDQITEAKEVKGEYAEGDPSRPRRSFNPAYVIFRNENNKNDKGEREPINYVISFSEVYWKQIPDFFIKGNDGHLPIPISTWAHSINTRFLRREDERQQDRLSLVRHERRFQKASQAIDNIETMLKILTRLATVYKKSKDLANITLTFLGDVQVYTESDEIRQQINDRFLSVLSRVTENAEKAENEVYADLQRKGRLKDVARSDFHFGGPEIYIVAHSEGTVISYNCLVQAAARMKAEEKNPECADTFKCRNWFPFVKGLVTFGSPLDKHFTIWENRFQKNNLADYSSGDILKVRIPWINYWDHSDPVGYGLKCLFTDGDGNFDSKTDAAKLFVAEDDRGFSRYLIPGLAHVKYWEDGAIYHEIIHSVMKLAEKGSSASAVKTKKAVWGNMLYAYVGYFLARLATLFGIVLFLNRLLFPIQKEDSVERLRRDFSTFEISDFLLAILLPFFLIWVLEETSFLFRGFLKKLVCWGRSLLIVVWWTGAFLLSLVWSEGSKVFLPDDVNKFDPSLMDRFGYLTALVVLCLVWKLHTTIHRGLIQLWSYTRGGDTGIPKEKAPDKPKKDFIQQPASGD